MFTALFRQREDGDYDFVQVVAQSELNDYDSQTLADFFNIEDSEDTFVTKSFDRLSDIPECLEGPTQKIVFDVNMPAFGSMALLPWDEEVTVTLANCEPQGYSQEYSTHNFADALHQFISDWFSGAVVTRK